MERIAPHCTGEPPTLNGSVVEVTDEVAEGEPEVSD